MNLKTIRRTLLWCTLINFILVIVWFLAVWLGHDWMYDFNRNWSRVSVEEFDAVNYAGIALYKLGNLLFCLVPCVALYLVRPCAE